MQPKILLRAFEGSGWLKILVGTLTHARGRLYIFLKFAERANVRQHEPTPHLWCDAAGIWTTHIKASAPKNKSATVTAGLRIHGTFLYGYQSSIKFELSYHLKTNRFH